MKRHILFLITILTLNLYPQQYGWKVIANAQMTFYAITFVDTVNGYCSGATGASKIFKTTDGGITWSSSPIKELARYLSFCNKDIGWATGGIGAYIYKTTNGGRNWFEQRKETWYEELYSTSAITKDKNITVGDTGYNYSRSLILTTTNGGEDWKKDVSKDSLIEHRKVFFIDSLHGWILSDEEINYRPYMFLYITTDGGISWAKNKKSTWANTFTFIDTLRGWYINGNGYDCWVYKTTDGGRNWDSTFFWYHLDGGFQALSFTDSLNGWAFGQTSMNGYFQGIILRTTNGGYNWFIESIGLTSGYEDGIMIDKHHGWGVGEDGRIIAYKELTNVEESNNQRPEKYKLIKNYPNPFNSSTIIEYEIPHRSKVKITIYNSIGKEIETLVNEEKEPGKYKTEFRSKKHPSGIYYAKMIADKYTGTLKMNLIK